MSSRFKQNNKSLDFCILVSVALLVTLVNGKTRLETTPLNNKRPSLVNTKFKAKTLGHGSPYFIALVTNFHYYEETFFCQKHFVF